MSEEVVKEYGKLFGKFLKMFVRLFIAFVEWSFVLLTTAFFEIGFENYFDKEVGIVWSIMIGFALVWKLHDFNKTFIPYLDSLVERVIKESD